MTDGKPNAHGAAMAHVVHRTATRLRVKIPAHRGDHAFFAHLEQRLGGIPKIESALCNPTTASVLLRFAEGDGAGIAAALEALDLLSVKHGPEDDAAAAAEQGALEEDTGFGAALNGIDRRKLALTVLVLLLLRRLLNGGWLGPGLALAWFLIEVLRARRPPADIDTHRP